MMCKISKEGIAFCVQVERTWAEIFAVSPITLESHLNSKHRIVICAWVDRVVEENCAASRIVCNPAASAYPLHSLRPLATVGHNPRYIVLNRRSTERDEMVQPQSEGNIECHLLNWCHVRSNLPLCYLWRRSQCASILTEPFCKDGNSFCWWSLLTHGLSVHVQNSLDHSLQVYQLVYSIRAFKCISNNSELQHTSEFLNSVDYGLWVFCLVHWILILRCTSHCSHTPPAASPYIPRIDRKLYRYIDEYAN